MVLIKRHREKASWMRDVPLTSLSAIILLCLSNGTTLAMQKKNEGEFSKYVGDSPKRSIPYASDISSDLTQGAISFTLRKVADWQLQRSQEHFDRDWTFAVLYAGFMELPLSVNGEKYRDAMRSMGDRFHWELNPTDFSIRDFSNDQALAQTYLSLYMLDHNDKMLQGVKAQSDSMMQQVHGDADHLIWWWCDGLFMAPPMLADLSRITKSSAYLEYMDQEWWRTSEKLYDQKHHLFYRDTRFLARREPNGMPVFWSRGNGWVLAGLARVLQAMPPDYPSRPRYVQQFQQVAAALIAIQDENGLWRAGLLDPASHPMLETSGTSLITYGLAYGVNAGLLEHSKYMPHIQKAWAGLVAHIYADGRLGSIQPVGDSPGKFHLTSSYVYGVGGFLMAGSEIYKMCEPPLSSAVPMKE